MKHPFDSILAFILVLNYLVWETVSFSMTTSKSRTMTTKLSAKFKGVLFDMDGTLLDSETLGCRGVYWTLEDKMSQQAKDSFKKRDYLMEWELKQQTLGLPGPKWAPIVLEWSKKHWGVTNPPSVEDFLERWDQVMYENMQGVAACKGAKEIVYKLSEANLPLAIATSSHSKSVQKKRIPHEDIFQKFQAIVSGDDPAIENGKPAPDIYIEAARRINVDPKECIVFEDGMPGVQSGKAAGCFVVAIPDPRFTKEERKMFEKEADLVLDDLSQFKDSISVLQLAQ